MEYSRVTPSSLEERLDATYYAPAFLKNAQVLATCGIPMAPVASLCIKCNCGSTPKKVSYDGDGQGLIRTTDVRPDEFLASEVLRTREVNVKLTSNIAALPGDLLYTMSGSIGYAAVIPPLDEVFSFSNTIARARFRDRGTDSHFMAIFFNCKYGYAQSRRLVSGGIQGHVMPNPFKKLPVLTPNGDVQSYVGNKVRQAEALRVLARELVNEAQTHFAAIHSRTASGWRGAWRRGPRVLDVERLDAWFYAPAPTELATQLREKGGSELRARFGGHLNLVKGSSFDASRPILYFEIGNLDLATACAWPSLVQPDAIPSRAQRSVRPWDILVSTVRPERKNIALIGPDFSRQQLVASSGFSVLRASSAESAAFLCWFLRSDAATDQLLRWNTGAAYPAIDDDVPLRILMPEFKAQEMRRLGARWMRIPSLLYFARALTSAARLLVEALIERKLTEAELTVAHKDAAADQILLQRLTTQGLDATTGDRLFPDSDRLEELLEKVKAGKDA